MIFANMPDEIAWAVESSREIAERDARMLERLQGPAVPLPCPEQGLYQWRKPGTRRAPKRPKTYKPWSKS